MSELASVLKVVHPDIVEDVEVVVKLWAQGDDMRPISSSRRRYQHTKPKE
jgi:hypothetical protein